MHQRLATLSLLLLVCFAAAVHAADPDPEVCKGGSYNRMKVRSGAVPGNAAKAAQQLARAIAVEVHKQENCRVLLKKARVEKACTKSVKKGERLDRDDTRAKRAGTLYNMIIVERIKCTDGGFKVRYEARGIKPRNSNKLVGIQTRFMDVFDSSY